MKRRIAFFDFDGTVTKKDTLIEFIRYSRGRTAFIAGLLLYSPILVAYKLKLISNHVAKQFLLRHYFGNMPANDFDKLCRDFNDQVVDRLIRPKAWKEIQKLKESGTEIVIVSASPENWVRCWCEKSKLKCIATRMQVINNLMSGNIEGNNCYGIEKVRRIKELYNPDDYEDIYCYGDTNGDKPMLSLATISFYKPFR